MRHLKTINIKIFQELHHFADTHQLIMSLVLIKSLVDPSHYRPSSVGILVEQVFQYLEMFLDEEPNSVLVFLLLQAEVKQLEFFQLLKYEASL